MEKETNEETWGARKYRPDKKRLPPPNFAPEHSREVRWMGRDSKGDVVWQPWSYTGRVLERAEKTTW